MSAEPVCLVCRRPLDPEPDDLVLSLEGPELLQALRQERAGRADPATAQVLDAVAGELCRACGRRL